MDHSSSAQNHPPPFSLLATSILGIKGPLRIRPHGSSVKPHIILRRVTVTEDSSEDGEPDNIVRFSLFAAKRIEVKPGRELLLTVASPDGFFKDEAVVFEADLTGHEEILDEKVSPQAPDEEVYLPPAGEAIPPKMRRAWTKKVEEVSSGTPVTRSSVGVQAEPTYASISTQAQPACTQVSVQTHSNCVSTAIQVDPQLLSHISTEVQTEDDDRRYMSLDVQTDAPTTRRNSWSNQHYTNTRISLSPMDLGNTPYSQRYHSPSCTPPLCERLYSPTQWAPYSPPNNTWSPQHTWRQLPPSPPFDSWTPHSSQCESPYSPSNPNLADTPTWSPSHFPYATSQPSRPSTPEIHDQVENSAEVSANRDSGYPVSQLASRTAVDYLPNPNANLKPLSRESQSSSYFVSAGVLTVFDGSINEQPTLLQSNTNGKHAGEVNMTSNAVTPNPMLASFAPGPIHPDPSAPIPTQPSSLRSKASQCTSTKPSLNSQNAVASSSKVLLDRITPLSQQPPQQSSLPNGTRPAPSLSSRALEKTPVSPAVQTHPIAKRLSPIPDPKTIAYIPSGPSSNPLNIKPSSCAVPRVTVPPRAPRALARCLVGPGWPNVKATNTINDNTNPPTPAQPPPPLPLSGSHNVKTTELSTIISYSSPPPSPSTPTISLAGSKWKRVAGVALATDGSCAIQSSPMAVDNQNRPDRPITVAPVRSQTSSPVVIDSKKPLMSLRDRIGPAASLSQSQHAPTERSTKATVNGPERNLLSRISNVPVPSQTPMVSTEDRVKKVEKPPNTPSTSQPALQSPAVTPAPPATTSQQLVHPLPPKPVLAVSAASGRGAKRDRPASPAAADLTKRRKHNLRWPTVDCNFSVGLKGEGELAVRSISFSSDGGHFALSLSDRSIRIWNNRDRSEIAKLMHNCLVVSVLWMDDDSGIISLGEDGLVSKWTRNGSNRWQWAKVLDAGNNDQQEDDQICFAYHRDRIAVSFPRTGVKVWMWMKGTWQQCRGILRQNVSSLRFVEDGEALLGGTRDGVLWYCEVPNGTLRAYAFLKAKITSLDLNPAGTHVLVSQIGGFARLLSIRQTNKGSVELSYSCKETEARPNIGFGAVFATQGQAVLFGSVEGCVLVWDRKKGAIVYGLAHEEGDVIQAVASFDGSLNKEGCLLTGTSKGHLAWWSQPVADANNTGSNKRARSS